MLMVRRCNAALGAPGPIPSGPFPHQNPKSRDADSAGFVRGSLQQDHAAAETTNQQILICGDRKVVSASCLPIFWRSKTIANDAIILLNHQDQCFAMFLRFIDHCKRLFTMVANHRSSDAMFAMYRSSPCVKTLCMFEQTHISND